MGSQRHRQPSSQQWVRGWLPLLLGLFSLFLFSLSSFAAPLIKLTPDFTQADLVSHADLLVDSTQQLTIEQVAQETVSNRFAPATLAIFRKADEQNMYWLRFGIDNPSPETRVLVLSLRVSNDATIAAFTSALKPLPLDRASVLTLVIPPQSKQLFYLRVGPDALELSQLELLSIERYLAHYHALSWMTGVFQGGFIFIALIALCAKIFRSDNAYLWLAGNCITLVAFLTLHRADFNSFFSAYTPDWNIRSPLLQICFLVSNIVSLRLAQHLKISHTPRELQLLSLFVVINTLAIPFPFFVSPRLGTTITIGLLVITTVLTLGIAIYNFLLSHRRELLVYTFARFLVFLTFIGGSLAWLSHSELRLLADNALPFALGAEAIALLGILLWRSFEQQREQARREREIAVLEAEARSRTEIVAEVGHRVRTPISGVIGMLDMLQDTSLSSTQLDYVNTVRRASNELLNTVNEISDISRLQSQAPLLQSMFDPHALVTECLDGFRSAAAKNLEVISDISPELPASVCGDSTRLRQIILQLMHHIVSQYKNGEIVVQMRQLRRDWLRMTIISHAVASDDFGDARRLNPSHPANLRFAIARQLVQLLGGHLDTQTGIDGNLRIFVDLELPFAEREMQSSLLDSALQNKRLLVIDDNETFCEVIKRQLQHWRMIAFVAHSVHEGLARLRNQQTINEPIDILLIDIDMQELRQSDLMQRLHHEIEPLPSIFFLSSEPDKNVLAHSFDSRHIFLKPINHTHLKMTLIDEFKRRSERRLPISHKRSEPIRCLFAEDNSLNAEVLSSMLDRLGVIYTATSNGQEAVDACRRGNFDIVLLDWDMPVMDGWEAGRRIREIFEERQQASIPIITLTANTVEELGERARQSVADAHLVKPIQLQHLRELLEHWTGKTISPNKQPLS